MLFRSGKKTLYLTKGLSTILTDGQAPFAARAIPSMVDEICAKINQRVEEIIANDRSNLPTQIVSSGQAKRDLQYYQDYGAKETVICQIFANQAPDGQFHSDYILNELPEAAFMAWLQDPEGFIETEAEQYIKINQEKFLLQFLKDDALLAEYQALMQDTENPIHRMKAITEALKASGAKTVTVTVEKDGKELTFKTAANSLTGHRNYYSTYDIPAQDRREFERLFGRSANYSAEDIIRITYGKKTLYEAPPIQAEDMAERIEMGGMQLG